MDNSPGGLPGALDFSILISGPTELRLVSPGPTLFVRMLFS
jgi:hypothetical protein